MRNKKLEGSGYEIVIFINKPVSQSCAVAVEQFWRVIGQSNFTYKRLAATKAYQSLVFVLHITALWSMKQSSILSAKFDILVAGQDVGVIGGRKHGLFSTFIDLQSTFPMLTALKVTSFS